MSQVTVYSKVPVQCSQLSVALLNLETLGQPVQVLPVEQLPTAPPLRLGARRAELESVQERLTAINEALTRHEDGYRLLDAGTENGLRAERDMLLSRKRGLEQTLGALQKGRAGQ